MVVMAVTTVCVVVPPGFQALLMAVGLIRTLASQRSGRKVLVCTSRDFLGVLPRLFHGTKVTFWFDEACPETCAERARSRGMDVLVLPADPREMYEAAGLSPSAMHSAWYALRDEAREDELASRVVDAHGPTFVLTWDAEATRRPLQTRLLPAGVPVVDAAALDVPDPLDFCTLMAGAMQVHATDGWFLTLADLVGGSSRKFCHAYAGETCATACRKKYRRRVSIFCKANTAAVDAS